jgi:YHS domain-containing protein
MSPSRCAAISAILLSLLTGGGLGCASTPTPESAETRAPEAAASNHDAHAHHALRQGDGLAGSNAPTSFAERPEVGTEFTCPVSGGVFEVEPHTRVSFYEGRYYAFCCGGCQQDFDADPAHILEALREKQG